MLSDYSKKPSAAIASCANQVRFGAKAAIGGQARVCGGRLKAELRTAAPFPRSLLFKTPEPKLPRGAEGTVVASRDLRASNPDDWAGCVVGGLLGANRVCWWGCRKFCNFRNGGVSWRPFVPNNAAIGSIG